MTGKHTPSKLFAAATFVALLGLTLLFSRADERPAVARVAQPAPPLEVFPSAVSLETSLDRQGLVVRVNRPDGVSEDVTTAPSDELKLSVDDPSVAALDGRTLRPVGDGQTTVKIQYGEHLVTVPVTSKAADTDRPISFKLDVMPVFLQAGCNSGSCHGAGRGQDGFMLSLFGYDPDGDYDRITREIATRRINLAQPEQSLMVQKSIGAVPHTGGKLFEEGSHQYDAFVRWLAAGAPKDSEDVAVPTSLEILPNKAVLADGGARQQMTVRATYSDGTDRDVTHLALFLSSNDTSAKIGPDGVVETGQRGEAFVMARFATFTVGSQVIVVPRDQQYAWPDVPENNYVDALVHDKLKRLRMTPSELADDATFLRRVYLDLIGQLPPREAFEAFVADTDPQKREKLVDELLARPEFVDVWVMKWAELLQVRSRNEGPEVSYKAVLLYYDWLRERLTAGVPMDDLVRELLTATGGSFENPPTNFYTVERDRLKLMENTAQVFMGIRLQCAQCHNHPFDRWTQDEYYGFASFFTQVGRKQGVDPRETIVFNAGGGEVPHPVTKKPMPPRFLGGDVVDTKGKDRRAVLAEWLTAPENPFFARNLANLVWAHFLGKGIIDPVDDVRISNPPSNPELLDELSRRLVAYDFDLRRLVRDIVTSRTYQLSTRPNDTNALDDRNFAKAPIRRIRAEVLLDVISQVTEAPEKFRGLPLGARAVEIADGRTNNYFLTTFGRATRETVCSCEVKMEPNLSQALHLLNGNTVQQKVERGQVVKRLVQEERRTPEQVIEELYVRCLTRRPTPEEVAHLTEHLADAKDDAERQAVLRDVFWALLNAREFMFNH